MTARPFRAMLWADDMPPIRNEKGHVDLLAHRVLSHLARRADNDTLQAWPTVQRMALSFGFERREIRRALTVLEKLALIVDYGEADSGATVWHLAVDEPGPPAHLATLEKQRVEAVTRANADRQAKFRARRNGEGGVTRNSEESVTPSHEASASGSNDGSGVTPEPALEARNSEGGVMSQRGRRYVTAESPLRNAASAPLTTKDQLPTGELPSLELPNVDSPSSAPEGTRPMLRNFNGCTLPAEPAKPEPQPRKSPATADPDFDRAWELYAYKVQKAAAQKAWAKAMKIADAQTVLDAIPAYVASTRLPKEPERRGVYNRAHFASWLNGERWNDEVEPPKKGYQGRAGADAQERHVYEDYTKRYPVPKLLRNGAFVGNRQGCYAWYWFWNRAEQADWTVEQLVGFGNTPEDAEVLQTAFRHGPPEHWIELLATINVKADA